MVVAAEDAFSCDLDRLRQHLSDESYAAAEKTMGLESLVARVASTGSFSMTCLTAATFGIDPPPANPTPLAE